MLSHTIVLKNIDPKSLHQQILQLEAMQRDMAADASAQADSVRQTVKLLHVIEEELRRQARAMHAH
ncbi:MAG TPA: hypothetical protein VFM34_01120 [Moraxellaceae bacterium]|nr:hypothetical protein [Moraxellaceae bacterium]